MARDNAQCTAGCLLAIALAAIPGIYFLVATSLDIRGFAAAGNVAGEDFGADGSAAGWARRPHPRRVRPELFRRPRAPSLPPRPCCPQSSLPAHHAACPVLARLSVALAPGRCCRWAFSPRRCCWRRAAFSQPGSRSDRRHRAGLALTLPWGQFGAIIAALMTGRAASTGAALAGVLLALMAVKPQFGAGAGRLTGGAALEAFARQA
jgi:hypothetical protein